MAVVTEWSESTEEPAAGEYTELTADQNTPNPWKASTSITVYVPVAGDVMVSVRDAQGRVVYTNSEYLAAGEQTITLTSDDILQSGIYIYEIESDNQVVNGKMIRIE